MENHVFKPHYRHGHHHHKNQMFYALLSMVFFALIAAGVVASIYYALGGENRTQQTANKNNNSAAGTCLVGTVDCNDTPNDISPTPSMFDDRYALRQPALEDEGVYTAADAGYEVEIPAGMEVRGFSEFDISIAPPESKWNLAVTVVPNATGLSLEDAFQQEIESRFSSWGLEDRQTFNVRVDGVPARRVSIRNFGDVGETVIVAINGDYIYTISGSTGLESTTPDNNVLNFAANFQFLD